MSTPKNENQYNDVLQNMQILTSMIFSFALMLAFVSAPADTAIACSKGGNCTKMEVKKNCCGEKDDDHFKPCSKKDGCDGECGQKGCRCPQTCSVGQFLDTPIQFALNPFISHFSSKADWYFLNKIPAAVYLSVWLPPQI